MIICGVSQVELGDVYILRLDFSYCGMCYVTHHITCRVTYHVTSLYTKVWYEFLLSTWLTLFTDIALKVLELVMH